MLIKHAKIQFKCTCLAKVTTKTSETLNRQENHFAYHITRHLTDCWFNESKLLIIGFVYIDVSKAVYTQYFPVVCEKH